MTTATARAFPNIALVKYWGKRDEELILPVAGSLSLTLDAFPTTTTVTLTPDAQADSFSLGGDVATGETALRVTRFLDHVRALAGADVPAQVVSTNEAPTGAGLASSAAGFAALATAASDAYGLGLEANALSRLARRGSGSAARSIVPGVAIWHAGHDDSTSFAEPVDAPDMRMVIVTVDTAQKAVSSREAMRRTAATSPFYPAWITSTEQSLADMVDACAAGDFTRIGEITESHALRMHAVIQACEPPIRYLAPASVAVFDAVASLREQGIEGYATADAGPNVAVIVRPEHGEALREELSAFGSARLVGPGPGAAPFTAADSEAPA
ncbi:diphosphomevalonate decarboxylase [Brevibacterium yomogidense]|uniref:diphosphomevalonate decarboxylase n=1 Tax=Brevibacterium yomogidense TaxID=946573 RepID=UPI0018E01FB2|nr:diphosphomevalonate decarboxylase [Brevibacterium yomogidense]